MALSYQAETSDGTLKRIILGIDFFDTSDIYVAQGDRPLSTPADYQWDGRTAINLTEVVPAGVLLMVRRRTVNSETRLKFSQGAPFVRENIDAQNKQFLFLAQEASEGAFGDLYNNLNMHGFRIFNLAEPIDDKDAATKGWAVRTFSGIYNEYLALCKAEADRAVGAANRANVSANKAAVSEKNAKASEVAAKNSETIADARASNAYDSALASQNSATASANSATASEASAVRAENAADAITGAILDGGACDLSGGVYPPPLEIKGEKYSTVWAVTVGGTVEGTVYLAGDGLRYTVNGNYYFRVDVTGEVKAQITAHEKKVDAHPISGVKGLSKALQGKQNVADAYEEAPFPDVWVPFNDSLTMLAGFGDYDRVYIGDEYLELNSRSVNYERATEATYIDKSGVLRTAAINEPRFERQGLLIEGQSTNLINWSSDISNGYWAKQRLTATADTLTVSADGYPSITTSMSIANADKITFSVDVEIISPEIDQVYLQTTDASGTKGAYLNLVSGKITMHSQAVSSAYAEKTARGYRFSVTLDKSTSPEITKVQVFPSSSTLGTGSGQSNLTGAIGKSLKLTHIQLEQLACASSRILTSGSSVTRAADKCWIQVSGNAPSSELSVAAEINIPSAYKFFRPIVSLRNQTGLAGNIEITCPSNTVRIRAAGTDGITTTSTPSSEENPRSFAAVFGSAKLTLFAGGALLSTPISNPIFSYGSVIGIGKSSDAAMNSGFFGHIRNFRIWHRALSDRQIRSLK